MIWAHNDARERGFDVDEAKITATTNWAFVNMLAEREQVGGVDACLKTAGASISLQQPKGNSITEA